MVKHCKPCRNSGLAFAFAEHLAAKQIPCKLGQMFGVWYVVY